MNTTMVRMGALVLVGFLGMAGCSEPPEKAYERMVFHAKTGNEQGFLSGFTERSQKVVKTMLALRRTYGSQSSEAADPYLSLVLDKVTKVDKSTEKVRACQGESKDETNVAVLTVTNDDEIYRKIKMYECEDGWKIDALILQDDWNKNPENEEDR
jgi:hypothetical protein